MTPVPEICRNGKTLTRASFGPLCGNIMGPILFDYGYGPFRWVCLSGKDEDLEKTDQAALACIDKRRFQDLDNYNWIKNSRDYNLVVGTKARILYQDAVGRVKIALRFNEMVRNKEIGPVMIGRDHHDVGGTDSPFRETANIRDGSNIMAEMATHVFAGNCARGMTLAVLHNGGGVGIGKAINGVSVWFWTVPNASTASSKPPWLGRQRRHRRRLGQGIEFACDCGRTQFKFRRPDYASVSCG